MSWNNELSYKTGEENEKPYNHFKHIYFEGKIAN